MLEEKKDQDDWTQLPVENRRRGSLCVHCLFLVDVSDLIAIWKLTNFQFPLSMMLNIHQLASLAPRFPCSDSILLFHMKQKTLGSDCTKSFHMETTALATWFSIITVYKKEQARFKPFKTYAHLLAIDIAETCLMSSTCFFNAAPNRIAFSSYVKQHFIDFGDQHLRFRRRVYL
jgi:hypothetical protein